MRYSYAKNDPQIFEWFLLFGGWLPVAETDNNFHTKAILAQLQQ
jgi:hypothetical protein